MRTPDRGQCGKRMRHFGFEVPFGGGRQQGLRANLVPGHERQCEQQFVLGKLSQVERACARQHVFLALGIEPLGLLLAGDEMKPALDMEGRFDRPQAALAVQLHLGIQTQLQPGVPAGPAITAAFSDGLPAHRLARNANLFVATGIDQATHAVQRPMPLDAPGIDGETLDVESQGVVPARLHAASVRRGAATIRAWRTALP